MVDKLLYIDELFDIDIEVILLVFDDVVFFVEIGVVLGILIDGKG